MARFSPVPDVLKRIQPHLKIADDHEKKDIVIAYWCCLYAVQVGLNINEKTKESTTFLFQIMDWLEKVKKEHPDNEAISNDVVAQAHIENHALKLFEYADREDRASKFHKNMVKAFYTTGLIYDIISIIGDLSDEVAHQKKYAQWKATYIHNCLKNGITPIPGPLAMEGEGSDEVNDDDNNVEPTSNVYPSDQQFPNPAVGQFPNPAIGQLPYPTIGFIGSQEFHPSSIVPSTPGFHAPPTTPNNSSQLPPVIHNVSLPSNSSGDVTLRPEDFHKAQKYCKNASRALQSDEVPIAIDNIQKALLLLTTGKDE